VGEVDLAREYCHLHFPPSIIRAHSDWLAFFFDLDRNLGAIDSFFNKRLAQYQHRLKLLQGRYGDHFDGVSVSETDSDESEHGSNSDGYMDADDIAELLGALLELRSGLRKLQWYGGE
jgi:glycerophosphodiester phosphodiesterase